jgi:hypothetical protein
LWRPFWKWRPIEIFQCQESIRDIIIYPHTKFWWYRTMLNFTPHCYAVFWQPFWKWQTSWKFLIAALMVTYHYVKFYVSIIIQLEVININVRNFKFPIWFYSNPHPLSTPKNMALTPFTTNLKTNQLQTYIYNSTKFHEILSSSSWDLPWTSSWSTERKENKNNNKKRSKNNKSPNVVWET